MASVNEDCNPVKARKKERQYYLHLLHKKENFNQLTQFFSNEYSFDQGVLSKEIVFQASLFLLNANTVIFYDMSTHFLKSLTIINRLSLTKKTISIPRNVLKRLNACSQELRKSTNCPMAWQLGDGNISLQNLALTREKTTF